jgi:hypothetical protein
MKNILLASLLLLTPACQSAGLEGMSVTTTDNILDPPGLTSPDILVVPADLLPTELTQSPAFVGKSLVLAPDELIKPNAPKVDLTPGDTEDWLFNSLGIAASIAAALFPKLAILEALFIVLSRRKQQHYAAAVRAALPYDGNVDLKAAVLSLGAAIGMSHSSASSKTAFEAEKNAV